MTIKELIGHGKQGTTDRHTLLARCQAYGLIDETAHDQNREMMSLLQAARKDCVIISTGQGYFIPTAEDMAEVEAYIRKEESRARQVYANLKYARNYLEDMKAGRI